MAVYPSIRIVGLGSLLWVVLGAGLIGAQETVRFTVTADARSQHETFGQVLDAVIDLTGDSGDFHISPGDMDGRIWDNRAVIDGRLGSQAIWLPGIGNHEAEDPVEMEWLRAEFVDGHAQRPPLADLVTNPGPVGSQESTYSWDMGNAHFIYLNEYWNGSTAPGSDVATDGDVVPELLAWLAADLSANTQPAVFVFGHEPAFPFHRHVDDSLNKYEANRDAFWALLERQAVVAYICGHTHVFSTYQHDGGGVWQIDVGNAGMDSSVIDGQTFLVVDVLANEVSFEICRNHDGPFSCTTSWIETVPVVFKDGFESGDYGRWTSASW